MSKHRRQSHQGIWPELTKLDTLRIKTEEQLVQLINHELQFGIRDARQAPKSVDIWTVATEYNRRANRACLTITAFLINEPFLAQSGFRDSEERASQRSEARGVKRTIEGVLASLHLTGVCAASSISIAEDAAVFGW